VDLFFRLLLSGPIILAKVAFALLSIMEEVLFFQVGPELSHFLRVFALLPKQFHFSLLDDRFLFSQQVLLTPKE
jgi:hypothetical protein